MECTCDALDGFGGVPGGVPGGGVTPGGGAVKVIPGTVGGGTMAATVGTLPATGIVVVGCGPAGKGVGLADVTAATPGCPGTGVPGGGGELGDPLPNFPPIADFNLPMAWFMVDDSLPRKDCKFGGPFAGCAGCGCAGCPGIVCATAAGVPAAGVPTAPGPVT